MRTLKKVGKGNEPIPQSIDVNFKYMISNLPPNLKPQDVEKWSQQLSWKCRVLRRFNNGNFVLGSSAKIPDIHLSLNGHTVLVSDFVEAKKPVGNIIAGKLQTTQQLEPKTNDQLLDDPWDGQTLSQPHQPKASSTNAWINYQATTRRSEGSAAQPRNGRRFEAIESEVLQLKEQLKNNHSECQSRIHQLDTKIGGIQQSLQQSLRDALQEQSTSLIATFEALIKCSGNNQAPVPEKSRERSRSNGRAS